MVLPKYNFYIGKADSYLVYFNNSVTIDNFGNYSNKTTSDKYASDKIILQANKSVFFNLISIDSYNAIFFYDEDQNFILYKSLIDFNNIVITPPIGAKYFAVRFTTVDANFAIKKDTKFTYFVEKIEPHYKDLAKKYIKENGQEFFRISLDGKINLFSNAY